MCSGLPGATAISRRLVAKLGGEPATSPASIARFIVRSSALAKTSPGEPDTICAASVDEAPKLKVTCTLWIVRKAAPAARNASVKDAAASTVIFAVVGLEARCELHAAIMGKT